MEHASTPSSPHTPGHGRQKHHITERPRTATIGPLDIADDPLAQPPDLPPKPPPKSPTPIPAAAATAASPRAEPAPDAPDFGYLLKPDNFHPLSQLDLPEAFRDTDQDTTTTATTSTLDDLLRTGHFRAAATRAATDLTQHTDKHDHQRIFSLLYTRLTCLQLLGLHVFASQEAKHLQDLDAPLYHDPSTDHERHLMPWELRVLAIRLQALGFGDWRRGVMSYYDLAQDARFEACSADNSDAEREMWRGRLRDLGVDVANALVEMGDFDGAARHLATLPECVAKEPMARMRLALAHLRCGSLDAARKCIVDIESGGGEERENADEVLSALCCMAAGEFEQAVEQWTRMSERDKGNVLVQSNLATSLLYVGRFAEARQVLEELVDNNHFDRGIVFNLATLYELCSEKSVMLKQNLVQKAAAQEHTAVGWERSNADFKL